MKKCTFLLSILLLSFASMAQVSVNTDGSDPDPSAMLDVKSENSGILIPRVLFANRPVDPANGLLIYQTDSIPGFYYYNGSEWINMDNLQTVEEQGYEVSLSQGGGSFMTGMKSYTQAGIDTLELYEGLTVHNATTNCINYYHLEHWFEFCGTCTPTPIQAFAGNDTIVVGGPANITLSANTPVVGDGLWSIVSGESGSFDDATTPDAVFSGLYDVEYNLQWAISTNCDTSYDEVAISFTWVCGIPFTDFRDGQTYETVEIGGQCWMAKNLAYLPSVNPPDQGSTTSLYYYVYGYDSTDVSEAKTEPNYQTYGVLYNWPAAMAGAASSNTVPSGVQGICPAGWHLPSEAEWLILTGHLGGDFVAGGKMKTTGTSHWTPPNAGATNSSGFTGLPGGNRITIGYFLDLGNFGFWWSSNEYSSNNAWTQSLANYTGQVVPSDYSKEYGFSVRCLRDQ